MTWHNFDRAMAFICIFSAVFVLGVLTKLMLRQGLNDDGKIVELAIITCVLAGLSVVMTALGSR